ncbi:MAG: N-acetyltransferase family protein [Parvularculaceae bacterium]|nr:N-acetyltransferase family protein [Parvularculaceae bacterium]
MAINIRYARLSDALGFNAVYNPFVLETPTTFETTPIDDAARRRWLEARLANPRWPVFVAEEAGVVVGFANASAYDERAAYETSVKVSVFLAPAAQGKGVGAALYETLFEALSTADVHRAYAGIVAPNPASVRLHKRFGFNHVATLDEVGRKFGRYYSVMWFEKRF